MTEMVTRCPECETSFRLKPAHLNTASGAVRCGSCLHIFVARDHLVSRPIKKTAPPPTETQAPTASETSDSSKPASRGPSSVQNIAIGSGPPADTGESLESTQEPAQKSDTNETTTEQDWQMPVIDIDIEFGDNEKLSNEDFIPAQKTSETSHLETDKTEEDEELSQTWQMPVIDIDIEFGTSETPEKIDEVTQTWQMPAIDIADTPTDTNTPSGLTDEQADGETDDLESTWTMPSISEPLDGEPLDGEPLDGEPLEIQTPEPDEAPSEHEIALAASWDDPSLDEGSPFADWDMPSIDAQAQTPEHAPSSDWHFPESDDETDSGWEIPTVDSDPKMQQAFTFSESFLEATGHNQPSNADEGAAEDDSEIPAYDEDESWATNLLEELEEDETALTSTEPQQESSVAITSSEDLPPLSAEPDTHQQSWADQIEPDALEIEIPPQKRTGKAKLLWACLSFVAALTLGLQFAYMNFEPYSRIEPWRTWYGKVCETNLCTLPPSGDLSKMKAYNLVVRSHPDKPKALIVDAIILNTADFEQHYPDLELSFSDTANKVLASRRFTPAEYLAGELAGHTQMPTDQPIHLSLEIVDPGPEALGYSIHIR